MITRADFAPGVEPIEIGTSSDRPTLSPGGSQAAQLTEGRYRHETDTDTLYFWDGSAWTQVGLTTEQVQDLVGAMLTGNTETGITVTYQDSDGTIDFEVSAIDLNALTTESSPALTDYIPIVDVSDGNASNKTLITDIMKLVYPIGCLYFSTNSTNPATSLGFGTWSAFGAGRVPVGYDSGQTEFDTDEETGGAKTVTLSESEMPSHAHTMDSFVARYATDGTRLNSAKLISDINGETGATGTAYNVTLTMQNKGSSAAHNNLQPYIVVRMWKRTA